MIKKKKKSAIIAAIVVLLVIAGCFVYYLISFQNKDYNVTFLSDDETALKIEDVPRNDSAEPPNVPKVSYGKIFSKWDADILKIKDDMNVHAICNSFIGKSNTFAMSGAYGRISESVNIPLLLCGDVCLSGFDITIKYDTNILKLESIYNEDGGMIYNSEKPGIVRINYVSVNNTIGDVDLCSFKFKIISNEKENTPIKINAEKVCKLKKNGNIVNVKYSIINSNIYILR